MEDVIKAKKQSGGGVFILSYSALYVYVCICVCGYVCAICVGKGVRERVCVHHLTRGTNFCGLTALL